MPVSASKVKLVQKLLHRSAPCLFWVFGITFGFSYIKMLNKAFTRYLWESFRSLAFLQGLKLINPLLGVAHTDLTEGLVLITASADVLGMELIVLGLLVIVSGLFQLWAQGLWRSRVQLLNCIQFTSSTDILATPPLESDIFHLIILFFWLFLFGVATLDHLPPLPHYITCILLYHTDPLPIQVTPNENLITSSFCQCHHHLKP